MTQLILLVEIAPELAILGDPPTAFVGSAYSYTFTAVEGTPPYQWSLADSTLPSGWSLNATTGVLSYAGTVVDGHPFSFTVRCRDAVLVESVKSCAIEIRQPLQLATSGEQR